MFPDVHRVWDPSAFGAPLTLGGGPQDPPEGLQPVRPLADKALGPHSVARDMWKVMVSEPRTVKKVLGELLSTLMSQSLCKTSTSIQDNPRILSLAVSCWMRPH